ncbi:MAG TPA: transcriptional regulator [Parvularcula sp.]|nr:transcriptional regulator [Parvularcula sp.]HBS32757.1 transcriptional regulator [Parvularcula sp.]
MAHPIDIHVGNRVRQRRRLVGMTQHALAEAVNIRFQQIQKYENGVNRISASRLWEIAAALRAPVTYFYDGLGEPAVTFEETNGDHEATLDADPFKNTDTVALIRAFYTMHEEPRQRLLNLAKALSGET